MSALQILLIAAGIAPGGAFGHLAVRAGKYRREARGAPRDEQPRTRRARRPRGPGTYMLVLRLPKRRRLAVGRLGDFEFPAGYYLYAGSAQGGLRGRVLRHLRADKKRHWHID